VDAGFDASQMLIPELPKRIGGHGNAVDAPRGRLRLPSRGCTDSLSLAGSHTGNTSQANRRRRVFQKSAPIKSHNLPSPVRLAAARGAARECLRTTVDHSPFFTLKVNDDRIE